LRAQSPCPQNGNAAWPQNSTIRFYIDFNLPETAQEQIRRAMAKWNTANQTNGSGVTFVEELNPGMTATTRLTFEVKSYYLTRRHTGLGGSEDA
jgi:hypothetical protein